jgi:hypothetical protein
MAVFLFPWLCCVIIKIVLFDKIDLVLAILSLVLSKSCLWETVPISQAS